MTKPTNTLSPFLLLCLIGFAAFFSSYLRIPVMPLFAATLGAGPAQVGTINGAFMLTAGLLSIPAGLLADRTGRKLPIIAGVLATAVSSLLVTQCHQPVEMAAAYVLFGAGLAAFAPGMLSLVADVMPAHRLGQAYGWYTTAIYIAMTLGPATGGFLAKTVGLRQVFLISGGLLMAVMVLALLVLPSGPPRHKTELHAALAASAQLLRSRSLLACLLATVGSCISFGVFLTFLPMYAAQYGYDPAQVGLVFAAQAITNVFGRVPIGRLADRCDRRRLVTVGLVCLALSLAALGQGAQLGYLLACAVVMGVGMALVFTAIGALIAELVPAVQRGLAMGMYNSCIYLGMMAGSTVMGLALKRIGYPTGFAVAGSVALVSLVLFFLMMRGNDR
ncbi:MFS transporter [Geobacter pelophilus]|uniref:MFS transporter n=1 Tax=Geoanaerobacter pelophilus TaxID=60036 RepID=A0AAW4LAV5_9BACT|nr:MFS transporter [Geoanaerobacter pelophilus]MBT0665002.1 MFS transporter [Geoanaerobacter pelophilus]